MNETAAPSSFRLSPVTRALGAEVHDLDLNAPLTPETRAELRTALRDHLVLFFRGQHLDDEAHLSLARCFGEPEVHPIRGALGDPSVLQDIVDTPDSVPDRDGWHTDVTYMERPPAAAVLRCEKAPESGGDTLWANMHLAYERLSPGMQRYIGELCGFHATDARFVDYIRRHLPADACEKVMEAVGSGSSHPLVRTHPVTGRKALFVDRSFMVRIEGLPRQESDYLHRFLADRADDVSIQCRFRWNPGDVAVWDEPATQHSGAADHRGSERVMRRCTVAGERPR